MLETVFRTEDLPVADRFDTWYQMIRNAILPALIRAEDETDFRATTRMLDLGAVQVYSMTVPAVEVNRPWRLVRQSDPEHCHLILLRKGAYGFTQAGRCTKLGAGDLMFYDSSHAFEGWADNPAGPPGSVQIQVQFPRALLPEPDLVDELVGVRLANQDGMRSLISRYLQELTRPTATYRDTDASALSTATIDLIAALAGHERDAPDALPPETRQRALLARIYDFIHQHLGNPDLSPEMIAAAHHISTRYLHKLFHDQDVNVAGWIRRRRLENCHRDLTDPRLRAHPINAVSARWGFTNSAHFSRIFRTTYGISASDYRRLFRQSREMNDE